MHPADSTSKAAASNSELIYGLEDRPRPLVAIVVLNRRPVGGSSGQARPTASDGLRPCPECGRSPLDDVSLG